MFAAQVYQVVRRVPRGRVTTYAAVARAIGRPGAARAVGQALRANPCGYGDYPTEAVARRAGVIRVPCHRVVRSDGSIGGFTVGKRQDSNRKILLLKKEEIEIRNKRIRLEEFGWRC